MLKNLVKLLAQAQKMSEEKKEEEKKKDKDKISETQHTTEIEGKTLRFTAKAGYMEIKDEEDKLKAKIFHVVYAKDGVKDKSKRPVTFAFNGGPGASSIWVQFGCMGPKRIKLTEDGDPLPPPYELEDNKYTWLEFTDLVFIDPVGTGLSRPAKEQKPEEFWGLKEDIESVGEFIRLYITKNERWQSPKFIAGESYGTTRAAGLSGYLQDTCNMDLNGLILLSSALNFQNMVPLPGNDIVYVLSLPTYTATARYHKKLPPDLQSDLETTLQKVEKWAMSEYLLALAQGDYISDEKKEEIAEELSRFTGLSKKYILNSNIRIRGDRFSKELLRDENRTIGRLDSRYKGIDADSAGETAEYDPSFFKGPFMTAINHYVRTKLKYKNELPYTSISMEANKAWKWSKEGFRGFGFPNMAETLRQQMCQNKYMGVLVACGYYDLATTYFSAGYTMHHLGLDPSLRDNINLRYYEAGHMMYYHLPSLKKLRNDVAEFIGKFNNY